MPVSASIYDAIGRGVQPVEDPQNALLKALKLQGAQQEMQQQRMTSARTEDEYRRGVDRSNKLQQLLAGDYGNDDARAEALLKGGFVKESEDYLKGRADVAGKRATTAKTLTEADVVKLGQHNNLLATVQSPEDGLAWIQLGVQNGSIKPENAPMLAQTFQRAASPEQLRDTVNKLALGMKDYIEKNKPILTSRSLGDRSQLLATPGLGGATTVANEAQINQSPDNAASIASAAAARAQQQRQFDETKRFEREKFGYQQKKDREAASGGAGGKTTEGERTAGALLQRLRSSQMQLEDALLTKPDAAKPGLVASGLRAVGQEVAANSLATGEERQQVEAAQLDILDAALTLGTGAAYTREQLEGYRKSYFPQIGDKEKTIADKQIRLKNIIEAAEIKAGNAASQVPTVEQMREKRPGPNPKRDYRKEADAIIRGG